MTRCLAAARFWWSDKGEVMGARLDQQRRESPLTLVAMPTMLSAVRCTEELPQSPAQPLCYNPEEKRHEGADHVPRCGSSGF